MEIRTKNIDGRTNVFDPFRRKWVAATPEEMVRQQLCAWLVNEKGYEPSVISTECTVEIGQLRQRFDVAIFRRDAYVMLIELKAPSVNITQQVFDQAFRYNSRLRVPYIVVSNLRQTFCVKVDYESGKSVFIPDIPSWDEL